MTQGRDFRKSQCGQEKFNFNLFNTTIDFGHNNNGYEYQQYRSGVV